MKQSAGFAASAACDSRISRAVATPRSIRCAISPTERASDPTTPFSESYTNSSPAKGMFVSTASFQSPGTRGPKRVATSVGWAVSTSCAWRCRSRRTIFSGYSTVTAVITSASAGPIDPRWCRFHGCTSCRSVPTSIWPMTACHCRVLRCLSGTRTNSIPIRRTATLLVAMRFVGTAASSSSASATAS